MKAVKITSTAILSLLFGIVVPVYAQHDQQGERQDHQGQQQGKHEQAKPEQQHARQPQRSGQKQQRPQRAQQQRQDQNKQQEHAQQRQRQERSSSPPQHAQRQEQSRPSQHVQQQRTSQRSRSTQQQHVQQSAWRQHRSQRWDSDHRTWQQRGGYHGYRIPDDRFRGRFGPDHGFRIYGLPFMVVRGYPRFQYGGYWISTLDPWPEYWGDDWYDNDDMSVTYVDNGYYMYNRRYPNVGIAISISL